MSVRFTEKNGIVDDQGIRLEIPYEELLKACLKEEYSTIRIREIIFGAVEELLGQKVMINNCYNKSNLFRMLEQNIQQYPAYLAAKRKVRIREEKYRDKTPKIDTISRTAQRAERRMLLRKSRGRLY